MKGEFSVNRIRFVVGFIASIVAVMFGIVLLVSSIDSIEYLIIGIPTTVLGIVGMIICWYVLNR